MDQSKRHHERVQLYVEPEIQPWSWRNLRDAGLTVSLWPLNWTKPTVEAAGDQFGATYRLQIGPFDFALEVNDGSWRKNEEPRQ